MLYTTTTATAVDFVSFGPWCPTFTSQVHALIMPRGPGHRRCQTENARLIRTKAGRPRLTCMSVVFCTSISAGDSSCAPALSAAKACWYSGATAGEKAISKAAAVLTTVFLKLSAFGNGDVPMRMDDDESREALALLLLLLLLLSPTASIITTQRPEMCNVLTARKGGSQSGPHTTGGCQNMRCCCRSRINNSNPVERRPALPPGVGGTQMNDRDTHACELQVAASERYVCATG